MFPSASPRGTLRVSGKQNSLFHLGPFIKCLILGMKIDDECLYCGDKDSIEHTFIECPLTRSFAKNVIQWFNEANCCQISPATKELLFGIIPSSKETKTINEFNYTTLSMRHYIYSNKLDSKGIYMHEFINKLKYNLENIN